MDIIKYIPLLNSVSLPVIQGADIIAQETIKVVPDQSLYYHWKGQGFKVHIPAGAIRKPATLCIQASLRGQYQLPDDDGVLLSGVYWLSPILLRRSLTRKPL